MLSADKDSVKFLGFGVYEGDFVPDEGVEGMGPDLREMQVTNPRIKLDSGQTVWGCECWWGPEDQVRTRMLEGRTVVNVDIDEIRSALRAEDERAEGVEPS